MVLQCCVKGCETVAKNGVHSFPTNKAAAERWVMAAKAFHLIERLHANKLAHSYYKICRKHFVESDFQTNGKGQIVIKPESTPSLFLPDGIDVVNASCLRIDSFSQRLFKFLFNFRSKVQQHHRHLLNH